jgi:branched-subunit amino acid aminotransferase/4-amino-4-deoxychorismate lyase
MGEPTVYLNGLLVPVSQAAIPYFDKGIVMGATVTEMTRTYRQRLFRLEDHLGRLFASMNYAAIDPPIGKIEFRQISERLVQENSSLIPSGAELGLIHFVTAGKVELYAGRKLGDHEKQPTVCIHTFPLLFDAYAAAMRDGYHLVTPSIRHIPPECLDPKIKYRSRLHWHLAETQSRLVDPKSTPLLLDLQGNITECAGANVLLAKDGAILSPTLRNILPGVSRKVVIELATKLSIPFKEQDLQLYDIMNADEAFLSSTPFGLCPATRINGRPVGSGKPGPVWRRLMDAWSELVGLDAVRQVLAALPTS